MTEQPFDLLEFLKRAAWRFSGTEGQPIVDMVGTVQGVAHVHQKDGTWESYQVIIRKIKTTKE